MYGKKDSKNTSFNCTTCYNAITYFGSNGSIFKIFISVFFKILRQRLFLKKIF